jgi:hypothetical protein
VRLIRTVLVSHRSLGGIAKTLKWVGEEYALVPQKEQARTFGGGAVAVDVTVDVPYVNLDPAAAGAKAPTRP